MRYEGHYSDGKTAVRRPAGVQLGGDSLRIFGADGELLETWSYEGLELLEEVWGNEPVRLHHVYRGNAMLALEDGAILAELESRSKRRFRSHRLLRPRLLTGLGAALALALVVTALALVLPRLAGPLASLVPARWAQALGNKVIGQVTAGEKFCEAPAGSAALERLTQRLTAGLEQAYPMEVRVSGQDWVNAFAAPGGKIILLDGLLQTAETPEEVAGVLAHEIAHAVERHPMQGLLRATGLNLLTGALMGDMTVLDEAAGQFGQILVLLSFSRSDELDADRIGSMLLNDADIRGDGLISFFQRVQGDEGGGEGLPAMFSTHPLYKERVAQIKAVAKGRGDAMSKKEWAALKAICN